MEQWFGNNTVICLWVEYIPFSELGRVKRSAFISHSFTKLTQIEKIHAGLKSRLVATPLMRECLAVVRLHHCLANTKLTGRWGGWIRLMCGMAAVAGKDAPKYWLKGSVGGQLHPALPLHRSLPPTEASMSSTPSLPHPEPPSPSRQQICQASRPFAAHSQPELLKQEADSRQEVKTPAICQRGTRVKMSGPGTFPRAAGLLAEETRRMVETGACCHR